MKNKTLREEFEKEFPEVFENEYGQVLWGHEVKDVWKWFQSKLTQREAEVREEVGELLDMIMAEYEDRSKGFFRSISEDNVKRIRMVMEKIKQSLNQNTK